MKRSNLILIIFFGFTALPTTLINENLKYVFQLLAILFICSTENNFNEVDSKFRNLFDYSIFLYTFGILVGGIANNYISLTFVYCGLYFFRIICIRSLTNKIDIIKIYDSAVIGVSINILTAYIFDQNSRSLLIKLISGSLSGIARNRLRMWGQNPNYIGITVGLIIAYLLVRIVLEQYKISDINLKENGYLQYNTTLGYLILFINLITLVLSNTRASYFGIIIGLIPLFLKVISNKNFKYNFYSRYYLILFVILFINIRNFFKIISNFIILQNDSFRGFSTGFTGRFNLWNEKLNSLGPIGHGYILNLFDNNYLYAIHLSGFLFSLPLFFVYIYFLFQNLKVYWIKKENNLVRFKEFVSTPLQIFILILLFFDQQTISMTSLIAYFFVMLPYGKYSYAK